MGYVKLAIVLTTVAGLVVLDRREHQRTRQKIDEIATLIVAKTEQATPVNPPEIKVPPAGTSVNVLPTIAAARSVCVKRKTPIGEQTLPVDWAAITERGVTATNYQLLAGDRVFVSLGK